jgi:Tfp pilus assembly protein PilE
MTMRRGYTLFEMMISAAVGTAVLFAMFTVFTATRRMSNVGELGAALSEASIAMEMIHRDLTQAVQKPDPSIESVVQMAKDAPALQFIRGEPAPNNGLTGTVIVYRREKLPTGRFRILRQEGGGPASPLPGTYSAVRVDTFAGAGGPFIRLTLHVVAREAAPAGPAGGADEAVLTTLIRVPSPEMLNSGLLRFKFLDELQKVNLPANF